jgi:CRP-like cAMP-binding protein
MTAPDFRALHRSLPGFGAMVGRHLHHLLVQAQQNALCHALHSIEARLCRWLLQAADAVEGDTVDLTQEECAGSLGVQRTSVSMVAHALQVAGHIRTRRGRIVLLDRAALERNACECYRALSRPGAAVIAPAAMRELHSASSTA